MLNLNFLWCSWRPFPVILISVDMRNHLLLSTQMLLLMYFKIFISLLFSRLNNPHAIFSYRSRFFSFSWFQLLSSGFSPVDTSFSSKCSANTGQSFPVEVLPTLCRMEELLNVSYKLYPCLYIPVRRLSTGAHTQFVSEPFTFLRAAWNWQAFSMEINANIFLGSFFIYFPPRICWFLLKLYRVGNQSRDNFKHCFCVNTHSHKNWHGIHRGRGRN